MKKATQRKWFNSWLVVVLMALPVQLCAQLENAHPLTDAIQYHSYLETASDTDQTQEIRNAALVSAKDIIMRYRAVDSNATFLALDPALKNINDGQELVPSGYMNTSKAIPLGAPAMIDELSKLLADRFREELTLAFLDNLRAKLESDKTLAELFPKTRAVLLFDDPFNYDAWLSSFRSALNMDLSAISTKIPVLMSGIMANVKDSATAAGISIKDISTYAKLAEGFFAHPEASFENCLNLLKSLAREPSLIKEHPKLESGLKLAEIVLSELGTTDEKDWASDSDLAELSNVKTLKTFVGFTAAKHKGSLATIKGSLKGNVDSLLSQPASSTEIKVLLTDVQVLIAQVQNIRLIANELSNPSPNGEKRGYEEYFKLIDAGLGLFSELGKMGIVKGENLEGFNNVIKELEEFVGYGQEITAAISAKNYGAILPIVLTVLEEHIPASVLENNVFLKDFLKYGNLAVNLSTAQTSEDFAKALEGAVLPAQSYRLKHNALFSISVNAYAGGFFGAEYLEHPDAKHRISAITGFTAPIGIGFNWGLTCKKPSKYSKYPVRTYVNGKSENAQIIRGRYFSGHSLSLFASVIDVGAVTAFRLKNDEAKAPNVQWKNVIAPGAYLIWGIGNSPISLNLGIQYGPELRKVNVDGEDIEVVIDTRAWRYGAGLTVDIPLFNLYSRSEKVKENSYSKCIWKRKGKWLNASKR